MMTTTTTATVEAPQSVPSSPYRGIESFRYADQAIFFARDAEAQKLLRYVTIYRGVLLYGDSGAGKSSLVNAGFMPLAIHEGFTPDRLRVQPLPGEEFIVERIATDAEGQGRYLPSNLVGEDEGGARIVLSAAELKRRLRNLPPGRVPLLIFDQFEEFATLFEEVPRGEGLKRAQQAQLSILSTLIELLRDNKLSVKLLFVFREDYLAKLSKLFSRSPELLDQHLRITSPDISSANEIIRGSFEKFPGHFKKELSEDLTRELTAALEARSDSDRLNLSEVQIVCLKLWQADNPEALFREKGVQGVLEEYLSESLERLPEDLRDPALCLLSRLVTDSGTRNIVSEYDLITQVNEDEQIPEDKLHAALKVLVEETRLVRRERRRDVYFYDIVSEFLVPWITRKKVESQAEYERHELEKAEALKRRKAYRLAILSLVIGLLIALVVVLVAWIVLTKRTKAAIAESRVQTAEQSVREARQAQTKAEQLAAQARQEKEAAQQQLTSYKEQSEKEKSTLNDQLKKLSDDRDAALKAKDNEIKQLTDAKDKEITTLKGDITKLSNDYDDATSQYNELKRVFTQLKARCAEAGKK
jgi:hypothetical protein